MEDEYGCNSFKRKETKISSIDSLRSCRDRIEITRTSGHEVRDGVSNNCGHHLQKRINAQYRIE